MFNKQFINSLDKNTLEMYSRFPEYFIENYKKTHNITTMMASSSMKNNNKKLQKRPGKVQKKPLKKTRKLPNSIELDNLMRMMKIK